ncbi:MAG TPA: DUF2630 family protein, partial [Solirubrobacteraceae bacterium]
APLPYRPTDQDLTFFSQAGIPLDQVKDLSPIPPELQLFARMENLVGEEARLLAIPLQHRREVDRARFREISHELDRIWEMLRERAERLGKDQASTGTSG